MHPLSLGLIAGTCLIFANGSHAVEHSKESNSAIYGCVLESCNDLGPLHVASPQWQDQIIYFLMIDRFNDGVQSNNDQGVGVYEKGSRSKYNGGDLQGVISKLDYIQELGATAVWTTPQVANQWWDPIAQYWGYHGYWARDFKAVDEHYGSLSDYQTLSRSLHKRGMYLIQDIVVNHTGNFFYHKGEYDPKNPTQNFTLNQGSLPTQKPTQFPLSLNNALSSQQQSLNIFNWTPEIKDSSDPIQEDQYQVSGLDDMNTRNPLVREMLKDSFGYWIKETGVDAMRIDTAKYVEASFYEDFLHSKNGIKATAAATGRDDFLTFGEFFEMSPPMQDKAEKKINTYLGTKENPRVDAPIGFPLYKEMQNIFISGRPTSHMSYRLAAAMKWYKDPYTAVNFIDNHDVERFLANGNLDGFKQAYALMMTVPGIPAIYQGDEQAHLLHRQAMFAGGFGSKEQQFDQQSQMYQFIQKLSKIRQEHKIFSRGTLQIMQDNRFGPGILAYRRDYQQESAYVIFNSADRPALIGNLSTGFSHEQDVERLLSVGYEDTLPFTQDGTLTMTLPARSILIFKGKKQKVGQQSQTEKLIEIEPVQSEYVNQKNITISGRVSQSGAKLLGIMDGNLAKAQSILADDRGRWSLTLPASGLGSEQHSIEIYWPTENHVSKKRTFKITSTHIDTQVQVDDPRSDDKGAAGKYSLPGYQEGNCYMDLLSAQAQAGGSNLNLTLEMCDISDLWVPANGFDHLALSIYLDLPDQQGLRELPRINASMPNNGNWDFAHTSSGWGNFMFTTQHANAHTIGDLLSYSPSLSVDKENKKINIRFKGHRFGVTNWSGAKLYITTWDKDADGAYRKIDKDVSRWYFGADTSLRSKIADEIMLALP